MKKEHAWRWFRAGRMAQVKLRNGEDVSRLAELDRKHWLAISMPVEGVRFDKRMLELMDTDGDGRIRTPEVLAAIEFLKKRGVDLDCLFNPSPDDERALADVVSRKDDLSKAQPGPDDEKAMADWTAAGETPEIKPLGADTADANAALAAVEQVVDGYFTPADDMPLVTEEPDKLLPLAGDRINPKHQEAILDFAAKCARKIVGDKESIDRMDWRRVKSAFAPYRAWIAAKPVMNAGAKAALEEEERTLRYKLHLLEFLENYVNMRRLYSRDELAVFQTGTLRIDAKEMNLCFHVDGEAAHSALAARSNCCILYLKLSRKSDGAERNIAAVVTAGSVGSLYVGRNGVFYDRDGKDWEAVVTRIVESQVSLREAFWAPWKKLGEGVSSAVKKFLGDRQSAAQAKVEGGVKDSAGTGAAIASSIAAVGIGVGMAGTALAAVMAAVSRMKWWEIAVAVAVAILAVSLPSAILTWFKLRRRDIGAVLNASGWAINRPMYFSMSRARAFTKCARRGLARFFAVAAVSALAFHSLADAKDGGEEKKREWRDIRAATRIGGRMVSPGYLVGKIVLLDCRDYGDMKQVEKLKTLQSIWATYKSKPFVLLGSHRGAADDEKVKAVMEKAGVTYPVYRNAGLTTGESSENPAMVYLVNPIKLRIDYRGFDVHKAQGLISSLVISDAAPPGPTYYRTLLRYELEHQPGKAYLRLKSFRESYPREAAKFNDDWLRLSTDEDILDLAKLVEMARLVKDRDKSTSTSKRITPGMLEDAIDRYSHFKNHKNPAIAQEAKNALAELKWVAASMSGKNK